MGNTYLILKTIHIFGAILFLGNIIVTAWWKVMADRTGNPIIIAFAQRQVTLTDFVFTAGGVTIVLVAGLANVLLHGLDLFGTYWLSTGFWIFQLSGAIWVAVLIPIQYKQAQLAKVFTHGGTIPERYWQLNRQWYIWGIIDTLIPLSVVYWMVFKPV
jgi:uncharacterized membrane protein